MYLFLTIARIKNERRRLKVLSLQSDSKYLQTAIINNFTVIRKINENV